MLKISLILILKIITASSGLSFDLIKLKNVFSEEFANSSFTDLDHNSTCLKFIRCLFKSYEEDQFWANQVVDTWGGIPTGIMNGHALNSDFGAFDVCLSYKFYSCDETGRYSPGQHALSIAMKANRNFAIGSCLPAACDSHESFIILNKIYSEANLSLSKILSLSTNETFNVWGTFQKVVMIFLIINLIIVLFCTTYELLASEPKSQFLLSFSLINNGRILTKLRTNDQFSCLDGVKIICLIQVFATHSIKKRQYWTVANPMDVEGIMFQKAFFWLNGAQVAVDMFLFISGLLVSYQFLQERNKRKPFDWVGYFTRRLFRLFPAVIVMQVLVMAFFPLIKTPQSELRDISNQLRFDNGMQYPTAGWWSHLWYVKADFCLYVLSPCFLFPLHRYGYKFFPILLLFIIASALYNTFNPLACYEFRSRAGCWLVGLIVGFILTKEKPTQSRKFPKIFTAITLLLSVYIFYFEIKLRIENNETPTNVLIERILSPVAIAWIIYLLVQGHLPKVAEFLNNDVFKFLCKISYSAYVVHAPIYEIFNGSLKMPVYLSTIEVIKQIISVSVSGFIVAVPWCLLFEYPYIHLQRLIFSPKTEVFLKLRAFFRIKRGFNPYNEL